MQVTTSELMCGASLRREVAEFRVWAPNSQEMTIRLVGRGDFPMRRSPDGTFKATLPARAGDRYFYVLDGGRPVPDPVSRLLPEGVHGPTEIVDPQAFTWHDHAWRGVELRDYIIYELHVGTFSIEGTFDGVVEQLNHLQRLGISVIEIMPVAAFPGKRNWGYDGVSLFAVQANYGGPQGLKQLVDAAHQVGLGVILDVVYNHLGNEGNYLRMFGPYFTDRHKTPWGDAINYDQPGSEGVRQYVRENALYWIREYHLDGLRLDAVQTMKDDSPLHILAEIQEAVQLLAGQLGRRVCVIAETDENDPKLVRPRSAGGYGLDGVWSDDFHHTIHAFLTGEREAYYQDFGTKEQIVRALNEGFVFQGEPFKYWSGPRGHKPEGMALPQHVICIQNHDQVGNRALGERMDALVPWGAHKLAAALLLLAPETPLLFMGEEYGERVPFQFFTDYGDPVLQKAVSAGRRNEFKHFRAYEVPDPQDPQTFKRSRLTWPVDDGQEDSSRAAEMLDWYRRLLQLRRHYIIPNDRTCDAKLEGGAIRMQIPAQAPKLLVLAFFPDSNKQLRGAAGWKKILSSGENGYDIVIAEKG